jgi:hypothetical protein
MPKAQQFLLPHITGSLYKNTGKRVLKLDSGNLTGEGLADDRTLCTETCNPEPVERKWINLFCIDHSSRPSHYQHQLLVLYNIDIATRNCRKNSMTVYLDNSLQREGLDSVMDSFRKSEGCSFCQIHSKDEAI